MAETKTSAASKDVKETKEVVTAVGPVVETGSPAASLNQALTTSEQEDLVDDAEDERGGTIYYVLLDEYGQPTGKVQTTIPDDGVPYAPAMGVSPAKPTILQTPSGAPLTKQMNPAHSFVDPALVARNPPPHKIEVGDVVTRRAGKETLHKGTEKKVA